MPELVCDTSALIALHQIGLLNLLPALATTVLVPSAVERELAVGHSEGHSVPDEGTGSDLVFLFFVDEGPLCRSPN